MLKYVVNPFVNFLHDSFLSEWKKANVIRIHKNDDKQSQAIKIFSLFCSVFMI